MRQFRRKKNETIYDDVLNSFERKGYFEGVEYDYQTYYQCHYGSNCCDNDYCRCGIIQDTKITSVDLNKIVNMIIAKKDEELDIYVLDRLFRINEVDNIYNWEVKVDSGYYGEEIKGVYFTQYHKLNTAITQIKNLSNICKIKKLLELEYGYLLDSLVEFETCSITTVPIERIIFPNKNYSRKLNKKIVEGYKEYKYPRCICTTDELGNYIIVDGYHRMSAAKENDIKEVSIIVLG